LEKYPLFPTSKSETDTTTPVNKPEMFYVRIKEERKRIGMTQERIAERSDVSDDAIKRYEKGKSPSLDTACKIANVLGVPLQALVSDKDLSHEYYLTQIIKILQDIQKMISQELERYN